MNLMMVIYKMESYFLFGFGFKYLSSNEFFDFFFLIEVVMIIYWRSISGTVVNSFCKYFFEQIVAHSIWLKYMRSIAFLTIFFYRCDVGVQYKILFEMTKRFKLFCCSFWLENIYSCRQCFFSVDFKCVNCS